MADIQKTNVVRLKSGGPPMTVTDVDDDGFGEIKALCAWFDDKNNPQQGSFPPGALDLLKQDPNGVWVKA